MLNLKYSAEVSFFDNYINRDYNYGNLTKMDVDLSEVLKVAKSNIDTPDYKPMMEEYRSLKWRMETQHREALMMIRNGTYVSGLFQIETRYWSEATEAILDKAIEELEEKGWDELTETFRYFRQHRKLNKSHQEIRINEAAYIFN
jgi:hypothetical protein